MCYSKYTSPDIETSLLLEVKAVGYVMEDSAFSQSFSAVGKCKINRFASHEDLKEYYIPAPYYYQKYHK